MKTSKEVIQLHTQENGKIEIYKFLKTIVVDAPTNKLMLTRYEAAELAEILTNSMFVEDNK